MQTDHHDREEEHENNTNRVINNGGFNLNRPGSEGRYTRSHHFQTTNEWYSIFDYIMDPLVGHPPALDDTFALIFELSISGRVMNHEAFAEVIYIPLPSNQPNFRRCILHVEEANLVTNQFTGQYTPIVVAYNVNHPIARAITRIFEVEKRSHPLYQTNEQLVMMASYGDEWTLEMCRHFRPPGNDFDIFDEMLIPSAEYVLPDPALVMRANLCIVIPDYEIDPMGNDEARERWRNVVYPPNPTVQERRETYATFAAEQVNMHRYARLQWARDFPGYPNPYELPYNIVITHNNGHEHVRENNPVDRNRAAQNRANQYIQVLYNSQNNNERAMIGATEVRLRANQIPDPVDEDEDDLVLVPAPAPPMNHVLNLDG